MTLNSPVSSELRVFPIHYSSYKFHSVIVKRPYLVQDDKGTFTGITATTLLSGSEKAKQLNRVCLLTI